MQRKITFKRDVFSVVFIIFPAFLLSGCPGITRVGLDDLESNRFRECLERQRAFSVGTTELVLSELKPGDPPLLSADSYTLSLTRMKINDVVGNSLERCLVAPDPSEEKKGGAHASTSDDMADDILSPQQIREIKQVVSEKRKEEKTGVLASIDEDALATISELVKREVKQELKAQYTVAVEAKTIDFRGNRDSKQQDYSLVIPQAKFGEAKTELTNKLMLWRGTGIDGVELSIKVSRTSKIQKELSEFKNKAEKSDYFKNSLSNLIGGVLANLGLSPLGEKLGSDIGARIDKRITSEIAKQLDVRDILFSEKHAFFTTLAKTPADSVDSDFRLSRTSRMIEVCAVSKPSDKSVHCTVGDQHRQLFSAMLQVEVHQKASP